MSVWRTRQSVEYLKNDEVGLKQLVAAYQSALVTSGSVQVSLAPHEPFVLRNGSRSRVYVDHGVLLCMPETNRLFVEALSVLICSQFVPAKVVVVNVDSKSSPQLTGAIASVNAFRQIIYLPDSVHVAERGRNLKLRIPEIDSGDQICIVDDVLTPDDTTALRVAWELREEISHTKGINSSVDISLVVGTVRDPEDACPKLEREGINVHWLTTLDDIITDAGIDPNALEVTDVLADDELLQ